MVLLQCLLFWVGKVSGTRPEALWEFNFKFLKQVRVQYLKANHYKNGSIINDDSLHGYRCSVYLCLFFQDRHKNNCAKSLHMPRQYEDVHANPDSGCYMLQVTTLNFIFTPVVMGMTLTLVSLFHQLIFRLLAVVTCRVEFLPVIQHCCFCF